MPGKLVAASKIRWNSNLKMVQSIVDQYEFLDTHLTLREEETLLPGPLGLLKDLVRLWKPFNDASDDLSPYSQPTIHLVAPRFAA